MASSLVQQLSSVAPHTESTNVVRAINSTDLRGARELAKTRSGGASLTRPTQFCIRVMESLFTSIAIKSRLSLVQAKPTMTFKYIRARSARRHESRECRSEPVFRMAYSPHGAKLN